MRSVDFVRFVLRFYSPGTGTGVLVVPAGNWPAPQIDVMNNNSKRKARPSGGGGAAGAGAGGGGAGGGGGAASGGISR